MKNTITLLLCLALAQCGLSPAWADTVELPDAPDPFFEPGGPDASDLAASAPIGNDLAMIYYHVPADPKAEIRPGQASRLPLAVSAATGSDTRLSVDMQAINSSAEREGWSPWTWGVVIVCSLAVVGLTVWAVSEACEGSSHDHDSSEHRNIDVSGSGNTIHIHDHSPSYSDNRTDNSDRSTTTSTNTGGDY